MVRLHQCFDSLQNASLAAAMRCLQVANGKGWHTRNKAKSLSLGHLSGICIKGLKG